MNLSKRCACATAIVTALAFGTGCADKKTINGTTYGSYGLLNQDNKKDPNVEYEVVWGNVFWGAIFCETFIAPIYFFGFSLFEPVGPKNKSANPS